MGALPSGVTVERLRCEDYLFAMEGTDAVATSPEAVHGALRGLVAASILVELPDPRHPHPSLRLRRSPPMGRASRVQCGARARGLGMSDEGDPKRSPLELLRVSCQLVS